MISFPVKNKSFNDLFKMNYVDANIGGGLHSYQPHWVVNPTSLGASAEPAPMAVGFLHNLIK